MSLALLAPFLVGYLLGSIPFGLILTRLAGKGDIRAIGSGNIGTTNVLRTGSKLLAALTLLGDAAKGAIAVVLAPDLALVGATATGSAGADLSLIHSAMIAGAYGAILGHLYPVWLGFLGGKGVATYIGVLLGLAPLAAIAYCAVWLAVAATTRFSSLAALVATAASPALVWAFVGAGFAVPLVPLAVLMFWKHRANIARLVAGEETRIGQKG
ncbi:MAG: glycerol-3-phosphate 1-O-acyltransferase PlsY [Pseudomonadota bacterium]